MRKFDTVISKMKYDIYKSVAQYAYEGTLDERKDDIPYQIIPGTKSSFRCCVYRERAITFQRVRLAMGKTPNDSENSILHKEDDNIVYVINAACEQCSINRFTVTENCQGCLAKKCRESCAFKAISFVNRKAHIDQDLCKECGRCYSSCPYNAIADQMRPCKRACPVDAIHIDEERKAVIDYNKCIKCGKCATDCPFSAISDKQYIVPVIEAIKSEKPVYAAIAPSIEGQFGDKVTLGMIKSGIKKLGFEDVYEVALGADMVAAHEAEEFKDNIEQKGVMTSSCCPSFVNLIKKHYPQMEDKISTTVSPMTAIARYIKQKKGDCKVVFIGPCMAKKAEAYDFDDGADYVLTYEELEAMLGAKEIDLPKCESEADEQATSAGKLFARSGGVTDAVNKAMYEMNYNAKLIPSKCNGVEECKKAITLAKSGKLDANFIEGMVCANGCIGGPSAIVNANKVKRVIEKSGSESGNKCIYHNLCVNEAKDIDLNR